MAQHSSRRWPARRAGRAYELARTVGLFGVYSLVTVWWSWPAILSWPSAVAFGVGEYAVFQRGDFYLIVWTLSWVSHALAAGPAALFDGNTFFPAKLTVAYSEHLLGYVPLFAPVYLTTGNPILAINVTAAATYPLSALCMYLLARLYMADAAAALSGFFYAFTLARYLAPPHLQTLGIQYFPLILLASEQWLRRAELRHALLLFCALTLQSLSSAYLLYAVMLMTCPFVVVAAWHHRALLDRRRIVGLLVVALGALAVVAATMWPYLILRAQGLMTSYGEDRTALGLIPYFARVYLTRVLFQQGMGWFGYLLVLVGLLSARAAAARWARTVGVLLALVGCVAALGPHMAIAGFEIWSPYILLRDLVPGFATVRLPGRFVVIANVGFALLAGLGADALLRRVRPLPAALASGAVAAAALLLMAPFPALPLHVVPVGDAIPPAYHWLRDHGGGRAVLEVPEGRGYDGNSFRAYLSTAHWQPIVEGYAGNAPGHRKYIYALARGLPARRSLQRVVDVADIGWILVHRDQLHAVQDEKWDQSPLDGLERVQAWGDDVVYRVTLPAKDDRRARLLSTSETMNGVPIAPIEHGPARLEFLEWAEAPDTPGDFARARVLVENDSDRAWPAFGFLPRNLVALEATIVDETGRRSGDPWLIRFTRDLYPGRARRVFVRFESPRRAGHYVLQVRLVQQDAATLDRFAAPLEIPFATSGLPNVVAHSPPATAGAP